MKTKNKKIKQKSKTSRGLYWTPRILAILFVLFLALFSLDVFDSCSGFLSCCLGLFMHNIPVFILAIILWFSWKREWIAGIMFLLAGLAYIYLTLFRNNFQWYYLSWSFIIAGPAIIIGVLFILNWKRRKN
jgi:Na+/proline symporter